MAGSSNDVRVDLHLHSIASDGTWTVEKLVDQVAATGIGLFSLTDHDTVAGVKSAAALAEKRGLDFVTGVEVSSTLEGKLVHLLAYGIDPANRDLFRLLRQNEATMDRYDDTLIQRLIDAGYSIDYDSYLRYAWDRSRGGWKSLNFCIDLGLCRDVHSFFGELFTGKLEIVFPQFPHPADVVQITRRAGAIPVWAHPGSTLKNWPPAEFEQVAVQLVDAGIGGIECYCCHHDGDWIERCLAWADQYDLLVTGGSDYHGGFAGRQLGHPPVYLRDLRLGPIYE